MERKNFDDRTFSAPYLIGFAVFLSVTVLTASFTARNNTMNTSSSSSLSSTFDPDSIQNELKISGRIPDPPLLAAVGKSAQSAVANHPPYPFSAIGTLESSYGDCATFRVSECHIMTASHCVYRAIGTNMIAKKFFYRPPELTNAKRIDTRSIADTVFNGQITRGKNSEGPVKWMQKPGNYVLDFKNDWLIGKLDHNRGRDSGYFGVVGDESGALVLSEGKSGKLKLNQACLSASSANSRAANFIGTSGGPLWWCSPSGVAYVVGINTKTMGRYVDDQQSGKKFVIPEDEGRRLAQQVAAKSFFAKMQQFIKDNPCDSNDRDEEQVTVTE